MTYSTLVFVGDHPLLVACAGRAREAGLTVAAVSTDDPSIAAWARGEDIEVVPWAQLGDHVRDTRPDVLLSVGNLRILPDDMVEATRVTINFHDGPLPTYAGLHTPMWALLDDATDYRVTWHVVEGGVDEGDVLATSSFEIAPDETTRSMNIKCFGAAGEAFEEVLDQLQSGELRRTVQEGEGRYCGRYDRPIPAGALVPHTMSADEIARYVRALDFGPTINRVGRALLQVDDRHLLVVHQTGPSDLPGGATPGTVLAASARDGDVTLTVATTTDPIELRGWAEPDATIQGLTDTVLPDPTPLLGEVEQLHQASVRSEVWWSKRVAAATDPDLSHFGEGDGATEAVAALRCSSVDEAMAVAAAFVLAYAGTDAATIGVDIAPQVSAPLRSWFSTVVPVPLEVAADQSGAEAVAAIGSAIATASERGPFLRDVPIRMPEQVDGPIATPSPAVTIVDGATATDARLEIGIVEGGAACRVVARSESVGLAGRIAAGLEVFAAAYHAGSTGLLVDLPVLGPDETAALFRKGGVPEDAPFAGALHEQFLAIAAAAPDTVAVVHRGREITYRDLEERARRMATALERHGVQPGGFVGVSTAPGLDMVVGILGVLMAGAAYVPLDPRFPAERLSFMVGDAAMDLVLTDDLASVPAGAPAALDIGATASDRSIPPREVLPAVADRDLAYMMYTSGSTGLPKGVMVQHGNVDSFLRAMEPHVGAEPGTWLSVTTLSFDISVLELFYPLTRGWRVVLYEGLAAARPSGSATASHSSDHNLDMSLFFFGSEAGELANAYDVLLDSARFADDHGFVAVWTPERHFNAFGGPFPNPSVTGAAIAAVTERVGIRSGSCVLPLHHPVRAAEEWAVVDNLSGGRVGLSIAAGWHPEDFILRPQNYQQPKSALLEQIDEFRRMWRGEAVTYEGPKGPVDVLPLPRPVQDDIDIWYTTAGNVESFKLAGTHGFHLLTHLLGQSLDELAEKVAAYRKAWSDAGHQGQGTVTLMLHTFVTDDAAVVRETVREPMKGYLRDSIALVKEHASAFPTFDPTKTEADGALAGLTAEDLDALLEVSFARYYETSGLFGDVEQAIAFAEGVAAIDVDEIAALIDFGIDGTTVLDNLEHLAKVRAAFSDDPVVEFETYGSLMDKYEVTHLQCTPSEARIILADPQSKAAMGRLSKMLVGGEACPISVAAELHEAVGGDLINVYGPTETTIWSTAHTITDDDIEAGAIPIGRPLANTSVRVVAPNGQLRPAGAIGELLIGGAGVTAGYHDRVELTAERFVERMDTPGSVYRTGDLVSWRTDGRLAFHGRADSQVKVRGYRIELGEIEAALEQRDDIAEAVVVVHGEAEAAALVAHLVAAEGARPDADATIQQAIGVTLPSHMVPERLQWHAVLPTTPNGKVDRKTLSQMDPTATPSAPVAPATAEPAVAAPVETAPAAAPTATLSVADMAALVEDAWKAVLGVPAIDRNMSFFDHGGNSLQVVTLRDGLEQRLGRSVSLVDVFRYGTVNELANAFADTAEPAPAAPVPVGAGAPTPDSPTNGATPRPTGASTNARANRRAAARQRARRGR